MNLLFMGVGWHFAVNLYSLDKLPNSRHDEMHASEMWLEVILAERQVLTHGQALEGQVGEHIVGEDRTNVFQVQLEL